MTMYDSQDDHDDCQTVQILPMIKIILTDRKKTKKIVKQILVISQQHLQAKFLLSRTYLYGGLMEYWRVISDSDDTNDPPFIE